MVDQNPLEHKYKNYLNFTKLKLNIHKKDNSRLIKHWKVKDYLSALIINYPKSLWLNKCC